MTSTDFLLEIGCEELPARQQESLAQALSEQIAKGIAELQLPYKKMNAYSTPRRLAVLIEGLATSQPTQNIEKRGPNVKAAFDDQGHPTKACLGFAESLGITPNKLERLHNNKGDWLVYRGEQPGEQTEKLLPAMITEVLKTLPIGKSMVWGRNIAAFPRPVRWLVAMLGSKKLPFHAFGIDTNTQTFGHAIHAPEAITLKKASDYLSVLKTAKVLADREQRKQTIAKDLAKLGDNNQNVNIDEKLLDEVTGLVEWPCVHLGAFDKAYLSLPSEVLITAMKHHQKYFAVFDNKGKLSPYFAVVANIISQKKKRMLQGYERVLGARLADAHFFFEHDQKVSMDDYLAQEKRVTFQEGLGSIHDKSQRMAALAKLWAPSLGENSKQAYQAGTCAKFDLMSDMVNEFPSLQGIMGGIYAKHYGLDASICLALREHYRPSFSGEAIPSSKLGQILALADKTDTLIGLFALGKNPSGTKDPFALRRQALGIMRILIEGELSLDFAKCLQQAANQLPVNADKKTTEACVQFGLERLRAWYLEQGETPEIIAALLQSNSTNPHDLHLRLQAMKSFLKAPEAKSLSAANKRIDNLLKKQDQALGNVKKSALEQDEEKQLFELISTLKPKVATWLEAKNYSILLEHLASLREPVDNFFEHVMVMDENLDLRKNRLALLNELARLCNCVMPMAGIVPEA